jgi:elongation factor 1-alpha
MSKFFKPENETDNIEYKKELIIEEKNHRYWGYVSQMNGRLIQGKNLIGVEESIYYIGLNDDGSIAGVSNDVLIQSEKWLQEICKDCSAKIISKNTKYFIDGKVNIYTIHRIFDVIIKDTKIAFLGDSNVGKSTIISVITYDELDDGDGMAKYELFKHRHEIKTGVTSSITNSIIGIKNNVIINKKSNIGWDKIASVSDNIIKLIDLPGDVKYERTTLFGLIAHEPEIIAVVFSIDVGISERIIQYIQICKKLNKKIIYIINKCDKYSKSELNDFIFKLNSYIHDEPVFYVNNIHSNGLDSFKQFLLEIKHENIVKHRHNDKTEFIVNEIFRIPHTGVIVNGILKSGTINTKDKLWIGPINDVYEEVIINTIHNEYRPCELIYEGVSASLYIDSANMKDIEKNISKSNLLVSENLIENFKNTFHISIDKILFMNLNISSDVKLFMANLSESVKIIEKTEKEDEFIIKVKFIREGFYYLIKPQKIIIKTDDNLYIASVIE